MFRSFADKIYLYPHENKNAVYALSDAERDMNKAELLNASIER